MIDSVSTSNQSVSETINFNNEPERMEFITPSIQVHCLKHQFILHF
jgi:hypothetical protein